VVDERRRRSALTSADASAANNDTDGWDAQKIAVTN
jgi:hypothetical protein